MASAKPAGGPAARGNPPRREALPAVGHSTDRPRRAVPPAARIAAPRGALGNPEERQDGVYRQRFHVGAAVGVGRRPHLRLSRRRHQRHPRRPRPCRGPLRVHPGAARGSGRLHGLRARQVHRPAGHLHGDLRPGRDPPPERPLRRQARPSAGGRDRRPAEARRARRPLPAGGRSRLAVQGRRRRVRPHVHRARADAPPRRPRAPDRDGRAHRHLHRRARGRAGARRGRDPAARARHDPFGDRLLAAAHRAAGGRPAARGRRAERREAGRDAGRRRRAARDRRGHPDRRGPGRRRREGAARARRGA